MTNDFNKFLEANLETVKFNNENYIKALVEYFESGIRPNKESLIKGVLNKERKSYHQNIDEEYFGDSLVIVNSHDRQGKIINTYEKPLKSRFDNMLIRIDNFKVRNN